MAQLHGQVLCEISLCSVELVVCIFMQSHIIIEYIEYNNTLDQGHQLVVVSHFIVEWGTARANLSPSDPKI